MCGAWKVAAAAVVEAGPAERGSVSGTGTAEAGRPAFCTESVVAAAGVLPAAVAVAGVWTVGDAGALLGQESWTGLEAPSAPALLFGLEPWTEDGPAFGFWTGAEDVSGLGSLSAVMFAPSSWTGTEAVFELGSWTGTEETLGWGSLSAVEVLCGPGS